MFQFLFLWQLNGRPENKTTFTKAYVSLFHFSFHLHLFFFFYTLLPPRVCLNCFHCALCIKLALIKIVYLRSHFLNISFRFENDVPTDKTVTCFVHCNIIEHTVAAVDFLTIYTCLNSQQRSITSIFCSRVRLTDAN